MKQYTVDTFTDKVFSGNPAAVCIMQEWLSDEVMLNIAAENNLSETAFAVKEDEKYHLRWFTPGGEIDLCGHATLAAAFVLMSFYESEKKQIIFSTLSGNLTVKKNDNMFEMDFPMYKLTEVPVTNIMTEAIGIEPIKAYKARDLLCVLPSEEDVINHTPDMEKASLLDGLLLHTTAAGKNSDCISRSFAPKLNVSEDPVCGSGHCHIIPYWASKLNKKELIANQASKRGGTLYCSVNGGRVILGGKAVLFGKSEIFPF